MQINSRLFGEIDIQDDKLIVFEHGLMGFEELKNTLLFLTRTKKAKIKLCGSSQWKRKDLLFL